MGAEADMIWTVTAAPQLQAGRACVSVDLAAHTHGRGT